MKNSVKALLLALLIALSALLCVGCNKSENDAPGFPEESSGVTNGEGDESSSLWDDAKYTEDAEVGEGAVTVLVEVVAEDRSVTITVHTDRDVLGAALLDNDLVAGDESEFGLYIKFVNGMEADYDKDGTYWAISRDGEYLLTGADSTPIADGEHYEFTRTEG